MAGGKNDTIKMAKNPTYIPLFNSWLIFKNKEAAVHNNSPIHVTADPATTDVWENLNKDNDTDYISKKWKTVWQKNYNNYLPRQYVVSETKSINLQKIR